MYISLYEICYVFEVQHRLIHGFSISFISVSLHAKQIFPLIKLSRLDGNIWSSFVYYRMRPRKLFMWNDICVEMIFHCELSSFIFERAFISICQYNFVFLQHFFKKFRYNKDNLLHSISFIFILVIPFQIVRVFLTQIVLIQDD